MMVVFLWFWVICNENFYKRDAVFYVYLVSNKYIYFYIKVNDMWIKELPKNTYLFGIK